MICGKWNLTITATLSLSFLISSCITVGPDYKKPDFPVAPEWQTHVRDGLKADQTSTEELSRWWERFNDPVLENLVTRAISDNLGIREATERLRESRARRGITSSALFPWLDSSGSATRSKSNENNGPSSENNFFSIGFDVSWELDIFGGTRRAVEAADATVLSSNENLRDVHISTIAEITQVYIETRTLQNRLDSSLKNLALQEETYELTAARATAGLEDDLSRQQALYNLESTRSQIPGLRTSLEEAKNSLAILVGRGPGSLHELLEEHYPIPLIPEEVAIGVPADTLRQRPDVRQAEYELIAQTARVGVAMADFYPKLSLNGAIGIDSVNSGSLFDSKSASHTYGVRFSWPIFHGGAIRQNIEVQNALQEQALLRYEATILSALQEVENVLVAYSEEQTRFESLEKAVQAATLAVELAQNKYQSGLIDFSNLLDTQRSLNSLEDQRAQSKGAIATNYIRLFKALGGGWISLAELNKKVESPE